MRRNRGSPSNPTPGFRNGSGGVGLLLADVLRYSWREQIIMSESGFAPTIAAGGHFARYKSKISPSSFGQELIAYFLA